MGRLFPKTKGQSLAAALTLTQHPRSKLKHVKIDRSGSSSAHHDKAAVAVHRTVFGQLYQQLGAQLSAGTCVQHTREFKI